MANMTFKSNILPGSSSGIMPSIGVNESNKKWQIYISKINNAGSSANDLLYWSAAETPVSLSIGTTNQVLQVNSNGLPAWASISNNYSVATTNSNGLLSSEDKNTIDNIDNILSEATSDIASDLTLSDLTDITATAAEVNVLDGITATTTELNYCDGVTSNIQTQLNNKAASSHTHSSYVNQNAFSNIVVGSTTIAANSATDTLTLVAGSNITLTPDATNDKITIAATNTTYSNATTSAAGLMSAADKTKLNTYSNSSTRLTKLSIGTKNTTTSCTLPVGYYFIVVFIKVGDNPYWNTVVPLAACSSSTKCAISCYGNSYYSFSCTFNSSTRLLTFVGNGSYDLEVYAF